MFGALSFLFQTKAWRALMFGSMENSSLSSLPAPLIATLALTTLLIFRVPEDDGCDQQIEAGGPEELVLEAAVAQLAKAVKEDGPRQRVAGLALVEAGMGPPAQLRALQPIHRE